MVHRCSGWAAVVSGAVTRTNDTHNDGGAMNARHLVLLTLFGTAAALSTGCTNYALLRTAEIRSVETHVDSVKTEMTSLQEQLLKEQKAHNELLRLIRADQQVKFAELSTKVSSLEGSVSESQQRLTMIDQKTDEFKSKLEQKARGDSLFANQQDTEQNRLFQLAHQDFTSKRYDLAAGGFRDFRVQYPTSPLVDEAAYWIAECFAAQGKDPEAEEAYKNYLREYPQGKKTCAALLRMGELYDRNKKTKSRDLVWKKLVEQCPQSEEAKQVQGR